MIAIIRLNAIIRSTSAVGSGTIIMNTATSSSTASAMSWRDATIASHRLIWFTVRLPHAYRAGDAACDARRATRRRRARRRACSRASGRGAARRPRPPWRAGSHRATSRRRASSRRAASTGRATDSTSRAPTASMKTRSGGWANSRRGAMREQGNSSSCRNCSSLRSVCKSIRLLKKKPFRYGKARRIFYNYGGTNHPAKT